MPDATLQERIDEIVSRYKPEFDQLQADGKQMEKDFQEPSKVDAVINIDFDISWEKTDIVLDIPSVKMKTCDISFDLPSVKMNRKDMSFDTPSVRMVNKKVGEYPCFKGWKWYSCDIITKVPEFFMERQDISMDIPEVIKERHEIKFDLPEFFMNRVYWSLHLPQFKVVNVKAETQAMQDKGDALKARGEKLGTAMKAEIDALLVGGLSEGAQDVATNRDLVAKPFNDAANLISKTIDELVAKKIDPVKIPASDGNINLRQSLVDLVTQRDAELAKFDASTAASEGAFSAKHVH